MTRLQFDEAFSLFSLLEIRDCSHSKRKVRKLLKTFRCTRNRDLQDFLHNKALTFDRYDRSRTYIYYMDNTTQEVAAYFTVAISALHTEGISAEVIKLLDGYKESAESIPCFLIGQLGKADKYVPRKIGEYILDDAVGIIDRAHEILGGRFILLDAVNAKRVVAFYQENAFFPIEDDSDADSIKMIRPYF